MKNFSDFKMLIIIISFGMLIADMCIIFCLRQINHDILVYNTNKKRAVKIYSKQNIKNKITFKFIKEYLKFYKKQYFIWNSLYLANLFALLPQYMTLVISCFIFDNKIIFWIFVITFSVKINILLIFRIFIFKQGLNTFSKYS